MACTTTFLRQVPATSQVSRSSQRPRKQMVVQASAPRPVGRPSRDVEARAAAGSWSGSTLQSLEQQDFNSKPASLPPFLSFLPVDVSRTLESWLVSGLKEEVEEEAQQRQPMYKSHIAERLATVPRVKGILPTDH